MTSFLKNPAILREDSNQDDLLDFSAYENSISQKLNSIERSGTLGFIGKFGSGKSTLLKNIEKSRGENWIWFDAWKFPERKELWEGFVLEVAFQIGGEKKREKTLKEIEGTQNDDKKTLVNTIGDIPFLGSVKNLNHFFDTSPAKRVFEIQGILTTLLEKENRDIFIVVEDIDRSQDAGIFFLETLNHFLRNLDIKNGKKVIAVAPIGDENFYKESSRESYLKCLDFVEFFNPSVPDLDRFFEEVLRDDIFKESKENQIAKTQLSSFFQFLWKHYPKTNLRLIKLILRKAEINFQNQIADGWKPDFRVSILFEAAKYFPEGSVADISSFELFRRDQKININSRVTAEDIFPCFLGTVSFSAECNEKDIWMRKEILDFNKIKNLKKINKPFQIVPLAEGQKKSPKYSIGWKSLIDTDHDSYCIADFYLKY